MEHIIFFLFKALFEIFFQVHGAMIHIISASFKLDVVRLGKANLHSLTSLSIIQSSLIENYFTFKSGVFPDLTQSA
jgi:hypothetical protein